MDTCYYSLVQTHRVWNTRVNPNVNCRLWVIIMYQCRFISLNKYTTLVEDVDNGRGYAYIGEEGIRKISTFYSILLCT